MTAGYKINEHKSKIFLDRKRNILRGSRVWAKECILPNKERCTVELMATFKIEEDGEKVEQ